ncbi:hypothetical protein ACRN9G_18675 [Shewanella frigidimarina]|uniref:hypothetical protein n=1 Tax=Shewanella frigidimarina TaxID=56812 RepID=UPI003D791623
MSYKMDNTLITEPSLANKVLALKLHTIGMSPKCIEDHLFGTLKFVRKFKVSNYEFCFSRGSNVSWTHSKKGFKYSNILFKMYTIVSANNKFCREPDVNDIASTWTLAINLYPEMITEKICDVNRFAYLIRRVMDHSIVIEKCQNSNCDNGFIRDFNVIKKECWHCVAKRDVLMSQSVDNSTSTKFSSKIKSKDTAKVVTVNDKSPYLKLVFSADLSIAKSHLPERCNIENIALSI